MAALQATSALSLKSSASNGPLPRHHQPENQSRMHPIFILNVECSAESYSLLDKSGNRDGDIVFHNGIDLIECINTCLIPVFTKYIPQCLWVLKGSDGPRTNKNLSNCMITSTAKRKTAQQHLQRDQKELVCDSLHEEEPNSADVRAPHKSQIDLLFQHGFFDKEFNFPGHDLGNPLSEAGEGGRGSGRSMDDHLKRRRVCVSRDDDGESELDAFMCEGDSGSGGGHVYAQGMEGYSDEDESDVVSLSSTDSLLWTDASLGLVPSSTSASASVFSPLELETVLDTFSDEKEKKRCRYVENDSNEQQHWELVNPASELGNQGTDKYLIDDIHPQDLKMTADVESLNSDFQAPSLRHKYQSPTHLTPISLSKSEMSNGLVLLDQVEDKFIIAVGNNQVLALDQHAIHERILLEHLHDKLKSELPIQVYVRAGAHEVCRLDTHLMDCVTHSSALLRRWGFQHFSLQKKDNVEKSLLKFHKLPLIENEPLTANDFIEFMTYAHEHMCLPDHLKAPPAVQRILASKSCRTAVKFGDSLSIEECSSLLGAVVQCSNPFQCAHGRPSIVPLVSLSPKKEPARKRIMLLDHCNNTRSTNKRN